MSSRCALSLARCATAQAVRRVVQPQQPAALVARRWFAAAASDAAAPSAPHNDSPVGLTGGAPEEFVRRTCRIYKPSRSATQQGPEYRWKIEFDTPNKWVNPLMGWTSARDTAQQLREILYFATEKQAIEFAEREGFHWSVLPHHAKKLKAKSFSDNFKWKGLPKKE